MSSNNMYNILNTLKSLEPTPEQTVKAEAKRIYESVAAQGSITAGVDIVEARLRQQFAESDFSDTSKAIQKSGKSKASADAITASIGRKKLGQAEMTRRSVAGKKHAHEGVAEGSEHNVGGISHSIIKHPGGKHQVVVKYGDKVAYTSLHNSEEDAKKSLASQVAHSKKMLKVDEHFVVVHGGAVSQAQSEIQWLKNKIETLKPLLAKKPSVARQIKDLERQIRERELIIGYQKEGVAEGSAKSAHQHHVVSKLDGNVLASYKTREEAHKNAHGNPVVSGSLETIGDQSYVREKGVAEDTVHKGTYGTSYDPSDEEKKDKPKYVARQGVKGRKPAEKPAKANLPADPFGRTTGEVPKGKKGTKIKGKGNIDESTSYQKQNFLFESFNFANMMKETDQTVQEMLTELQSDIANFKMTGECSPKLDAFLRVHGHSKKQLADEAKAVPNYEVPAVQRKVAGEPPLNLGDVQAHDANRSMHPGMTKLDAPKPAIHDELDELAQLAGITDEGNAFTGKLAKTAHGGEFELDGKKYKDTSNLDEASLKLEDIAKLAGIAVEGKDYGDTTYPQAPAYDNTPNEEVQGEDVMLKGGDGEVAGAEKKMAKDGAARFSDNPLAMKESETTAADLMKEAATFDPIEAMGRKLMKAYEAIKVTKVAK